MYVVVVELEWQTKIKMFSVLFSYLTFKIGETGKSFPMFLQVINSISCVSTIHTGSLSGIMVI